MNEKLRNKLFAPLKDSDPFPFGQYGPKGEKLPMAAVPAKYLDFIAGESWINRWPKVIEYINSHRAQINLELNDEIEAEYPDEF